MSAVHVFNQYYWDLLKKVKDLARDLKYRSDDRGARDVLKEIKRSYLSFDKLSEEHIAWYREHSHPFEALFGIAELNASRIHAMCFERQEVKAIELYKGISFDAASNMFKNKYVFLYYAVLMSLFSLPEVGVDSVTENLVELLHKKQPWSEEDMQLDGYSDKVQIRLKLLHEIVAKAGNNDHKSSEDTSATGLMSELENTSIGKLAKEIMSEIDVEEVSKTIGEDGDILKALSNPEGGMTKLLGTVSQKMISKLASGDLKQDTLLQDAMKLAGSLPGLTGGGGAGTKNITDMMQQMSSLFGMMGGGDSGNGPDLSSMMSQFGQMMGGGGQRRPNAAINRAAVSRNVKANQLRRKLDERRKAKENIDSQ